MASERPKGGNDQGKNAEDWVEVGPRTDGAELGDIAMEVLRDHRPELLLVADANMPGDSRERAKQAEDVVGAVFVALLAGELVFEGPREKLLAFLSVVCWRSAAKSSDRNRRMVDLDGVRSSVSSPGRDPLLSAELAELAEQVWAALDALPPNMKEVARLHWLEERTSTEIAAQLSCSAETVRVHLKRAAKRLRESLRPVRPSE